MLSESESMLGVDVSVHGEQMGNTCQGNWRRAGKSWVVDSMFSYRGEDVSTYLAFLLQQQEGGLRCASCHLIEVWNKIGHS